MSTYAEIQPIQTPIPANRQGARRHYGVHPYFTRRPFNVVREYILRYSRPHDKVLDPFGGSGVTAVEAFLENRIGIQNDLNPLANFIAKGIAGLCRGDIRDYQQALAKLEAKCQSPLQEIAVASEEHLQKFAKSVRLPADSALPANSDAAHYHDLFSHQQLISLALLRDTIRELPGQYARDGMTLAWSATLSKLNRTFLSANGRAASRGGSSIFSIYRYKVAKSPIELPAWETFKERAENVIAAKAEIGKIIEWKRRTGEWCGHFEVHEEDILELAERLRGKIDYIFTDPPYGGHISYLDLSTLWNVWLEQAPTPNAYRNELIVGGELEHTEDRYIERLDRSIRACVRMLKPGRWLSVVFQHWNIAYFEAILSAADEAGAELRAAISQVGDPIWSMHKKKGNESVLAGELILTFFKTGLPASKRLFGPFELQQALRAILSECGDKVYGEYIFNELVIRAWRHSAIAALALSKEEFVSLLRDEGWSYSEKEHLWAKAGGPVERWSLFDGVAEPDGTKRT